MVDLCGDEIVTAAQRPLLGTPAECGSTPGAATDGERATPRAGTRKGGHSSGRSDYHSWGKGNSVEQCLIPTQPSIRLRNSRTARSITTRESLPSL